MTLPSHRRVLLDPDGTWDSSWLAVVIASPTGVIYEHQCAGVACESRQVEGYLVPLGRLKFDPDAGRVDPAEFTALFHAGESCVWSLSGERFPRDRLNSLRSLVAAVTFWQLADDGKVQWRTHLELDESRLSELAEAWVPVRTPDGQGILLWNNCD